MRARCSWASFHSSSCFNPHYSPKCGPVQGRLASAHSAIERPLDRRRIRPADASTLERRRRRNSRQLDHPVAAAPVGVANCVWDIGRGRNCERDHERGEEEPHLGVVGLLVGKKRPYYLTQSSAIVACPDERRP